MSFLPVYRGKHAIFQRTVLRARPPKSHKSQKKFPDRPLSNSTCSVELLEELREVRDSLPIKERVVPKQLLCATLGPMRLKQQPLISLLLLCFAFTACSKDKNKAQPQAKDQVEAPSASKPQEEKKPRSTIATEEELKSFLQSWIVSQNSGNFENYSKLYASKFSGTKRVKDRVSYFDHDGWLKDRQKLFSKSFSVLAQEPQFFPETGLIIFNQVWSNDNFRDEGKKELILVKEEGQLKLSVERMLESKAPKSHPLDVSAGAFLHKTHHHWALQLDDAVDINWISGTPELIQDFSIERSLSEKALPASVLEYKDKNYEAFDAQGRRCAGKAIAFKSVTTIEPHFGTVQSWDTEFPNASPNMRKQKALAIWETAMARGASPSSPDATALTVEIDFSGECEQPIWGRVVQETAPALVLVLRDTSPVDQAHESAIKATVATHPTLSKNSAYRSSDPSFYGLEAFKSSLGKEFRSLNVSFGEGCEGAFGPTSIVGTMNGNNIRWQGGLVTGPILQLVDLNGDGIFELITEREIYQEIDGEYISVSSKAYGYYDCPC